MNWKIGAVQAADVQGDIPRALIVISKFMAKADVGRLTVVCFPECFFQGYTLDETETKARSLDLKSAQFRDVLTKLSQYRATIILGVIEEDRGEYFNTAVVIKHGKLIGKYRKVNLFEKNFQCGDENPVFTVDGLTFGINICYDARFSEGANEMVSKGAKVIFYPLNNKLSKDKAIKYRDKHLPNLLDRANDTGCWVVSSDVIAQDNGFIGYGCTAIVGPNGDAINRVPELREGIVGLTLPL